MRTLGRDHDVSPCGSGGWLWVHAALFHPISFVPPLQLAPHLPLGVVEMLELMLSLSPLVSSGAGALRGVSSTLPSPDALWVSVLYCSGGLNKSRYRGVSYDRKKAKWRVQIKVGGAAELAWPVEPEKQPRPEGWHVPYLVFVSLASPAPLPVITGGGAGQERCVCGIF